jgi:8-oxo-dGTP diphosphatase
MENSKHSGAGILFVNDNGQILLCLRDDKPDIPCPNCWDIIGGHVEQGETPEECIVREVKEEIGRDIKKLNFYKKTDMSARGCLTAKDRIEHTYWEKVDIDIKQTILTEGQKLKWFTEEQIKKLPEEKIAFGFKPIILSFFKDKPFKSGE